MPPPQAGCWDCVFLTYSREKSPWGSRRQTGEQLCCCEERSTSQFVLLLSLHLSPDVSVPAQCAGEVAGPWEDRAGARRGARRSQGLSRQSVGARSCLLGLLHQALAMLYRHHAVIFHRGVCQTQCSGEAGTTLSTKEQLAPCPHPRCWLRGLFSSLPPSTKSCSLNPALVAASNKTGFPDDTHSPHFLSGPALFHSLPLSLLQTHIPSLPSPAPFVPQDGNAAGCACSASTSSSLLPKKMESRKKQDSLPSTKHLVGTYSTVRKAGQKGRPSGR